MIPEPTLQENLETMLTAEKNNVEIERPATADWEKKVDVDTVNALFNEYKTAAAKTKAVP